MGFPITPQDKSFIRGVCEQRPEHVVHNFDIECSECLNLGRICCFEIQIGVAACQEVSVLPEAEKFDVGALCLAPEAAHEEQTYDSRQVKRLHVQGESVKFWWSNCFVLFFCIYKPVGRKRF